MYYAWKPSVDQKKIMLMQKENQDALFNCTKDSFPFVCVCAALEHFIFQFLPFCKLVFLASIF